MRYAAAEKLEIIRVVEQSYLPVRGQTILIKREKIKRQTIEYRRLQHCKSAA